MTIPPVQPPSQPRPSRTRLLIVLGVVVIVVVAVGATILAYRPQNPLFVGPRPHTATVVEGQLNLLTSYYAANFTVPSGATQISVNVTFTAQGGSGNDIRFYAFTRDNFLRWTNHQAYVAIRETGQITSFNEVISLPSPGSYSVVYDNSFSTFSTKTVQTKATLTYLL